MRANKESRGVMDSQSHLCMKMSEHLHTLAACIPGDGPHLPVPIESQAWWATNQGEHFGEGENLLLLPGIEPQFIQPVAYITKYLCVFKCILA